MALQVIGAGFCRTGTLSLKQALDELGFGPTHHMEEVFRNRSSHLRQWLDFAEAGNTDWDSLFGKYRSAVDFPAACAWEELYDEYPAAKVVLTVRDPGSWWESTNAVLYPTRTMYPSWLTRLVPFTQQWLDMVDGLVWSGIFNGRFQDKTYATEIFQEHIETVRTRCDPQRLLIFEVSEGWQPLCDFLDVPVPTTPFPHANDLKSLQRRFAGIRWGTRLAPYVLTTTAAVAIRRHRGQRTD